MQQSRNALGVIAKARDRASAVQRLARERHGRDTQGLQVLYAIEAFLRRLSVSDYRERMVLKGGMLLAVLDARRMTRDADLSARGISNDQLSVAQIAAEIASTTLSEPDGVEFDTTGVSTEPMRESERALAAGESTTSLAELHAEMRTGGPGLEPG